jgi:hypothetical protein
MLLVLKESCAEYPRAVKLIPQYHPFSQIRTRDKATRLILIVSGNI